MKMTFSALPRYVRCILLALVLFMASTAVVEAATMSLSPGSNVYTTGATFTVRVNVNSAGSSINAAEGTLRFNPSQLSVVNVSRANSIFNLWVEEPSFSNSNGTISFSGGLPSGYSGSSGNIMSVTFRATGSGAARVSFANGSVLANDGRGSNVLSSMNGATYTIQAATSEPAEEVIVEYVPTANTPAAPVIVSETHPADGWSRSRQAELSWDLPNGVTAVRTLLSPNPTAIPNIVYDDPIDSISLELEEGVQYLHVQFQNEDGWGRVAHYRLAVDSEAPSVIEITSPEDVDFTKAEQILDVTVLDETSAVDRFMIRIDADEPFEYIRDTASSSIILPALEPGYHTVVIEAFDEAGNSIVGSYSFTILAFEQPTFTDIPAQINEGVIPVLRGNTRPNASVEITVRRGGMEPMTYTVQSDESGVFTFIPDSGFSPGVYELTAQATDAFGAQSDVSAPVRMAVQQPGYVRIGGYIISFLSVLIPLLALVVLLGGAVWYGIFYLRRLRKRVQVESVEALEITKKEFAALRRNLSDQAEMLQSSRKTKKLTKAEATMIDFMTAALTDAETNIEKEVADVTAVTEKTNENHE